MGSEPVVQDRGRAYRYGRHGINMEIIKGIAVSPGVAICPAVVLDAEEFRIPQRQVVPARAKQEANRLRQAFTDAVDELSSLQLSRGDIWDSNIKDIFAVHLHFLRDRTMQKKIVDLILENAYSAEYAVSVILRDIAKQLGQAADRYISERVNDIYDIEKRLLRHLIGKQREDLAHLTEPVVVVAHELTPTQTAAFNKTYIRGFAINAGGRTSHTAIVARGMGIPAVVALGDVTARLAGGGSGDYRWASRHGHYRSR